MVKFTDFTNVHQMLCNTVDQYADKPAFRWFVQPGETDEVTWQEFYQQVKQVSQSLLALDVVKDDKITIVSYSCYRWVLMDMAIMSLGAVTVGIYQSNLAKDIAYIINHSDSVLVFAEDTVQLAKLQQIRDQLPHIRKVILLKGEAPDDDWVLSFEAFLALGDGIDDSAFEERAAAVTPADTAGIVYTSGTTGVPKGVVLTHDNVTFTAQSVEGSTIILEGDEVFLFLPLAHIFARTCVYSTILVGKTTTFTRAMDSIVEDIKAARPHWFASVPRIFEKIHSKIMGGAQAKGGAALKIFNWACAVGDEVGFHKLNKVPIPLITILKYKLANKLVFSKIQAALGGRVRWCISGGAPLNPSIGKFFHSAGILILEGIGMTENMSFSNLNRYNNYRFGWVGPPGPGIEQKIASDGEVLFRGRNVMKEYYKMPEETARTLTPEGWLHTGDLGEIDEQNFLRITGRKKELIVTSGGKNIAPSAIEGIMATSRYLNQVLVIGDQCNYLSALVTLDYDNVTEYARTHGIDFETPEDLTRHEQIIALIDAEIAERNRELASFETIKKFTIVPEFTIENGLLTPTLKLKKSKIHDEFKDLIEAMYSKA